MDEAAAIRSAIGLLRVPSRAKPMRAQPLPEGVPLVLEIAAGNAGAAERGAALTGRDAHVVRDAAVFFIEQILLGPDANSYRILGAGEQATTAELRRNMALLLKWLHPDMERNGGGNRSVFAVRVTSAWDSIKTAERRAAYDAALARAGGTRRQSTGRGLGRSHRRSSAKTRSGVPAIREPAGGGRSPRWLLMLVSLLAPLRR